VTAGLTVPEGWRIALCEPETPPGPGCQPTVLCEEFRPDHWSLSRGACFGCDWLGPERDDTNTAVEDAHDHTHPGWREVPVLDMPRQTGDSKKDNAALAAATPHIEALYPAGWPERCGPVRAWRNPVATRHVFGRSPWGGYEMAVARDAQVEADTSSDAGDQMSLL